MQAIIGSIVERADTIPKNSQQQAVTSSQVCFFLS
jgi:unconventional prefoldin RPB5 interactor 1